MKCDGHTRRKERHVLNEPVPLAGTCPCVPKKGRKGRKGRELGKMRGQVQPETILAARVILSSHRSPLYIEIIRLISLLLSILSVFFGKDKCNDACDSLTLCFVLLYTSD